MYCLACYDKCKMTGDSVAEVRRFLDEWMVVHTLLHRERVVPKFTAFGLYDWMREGNMNGLGISPDDAAFICEEFRIREAKEMYDFLEVKCHITLRKYIRSLEPDPARRCDSINKCIGAIQELSLIHI